MRGKARADSCSILDELLADPLIQLVMKSDSVDAVQVRQLFEKLRTTSPPDASTSSAQEGSVAIFPTESAHYRASVGIMLLNHRNEVFVGQRKRGPEDAWQMPQGGIEAGEQPHAAALRELREEIGTDNVEVLAESKGWLRYDLPSDLIGKVWNGRWRGQQQKWFAMRFLGKDADIDVATEDPEFLAWQWVPATRLPGLIVSFKRQLYMDVLQQFHTFHTANAQS